MNSSVLKNTCQTRSITYYIKHMRIFRLRSSFLSLLIVLILSSLCFLLFTDLHARYVIANNSDDDSSSNDISSLSSQSLSNLVKNQSTSSSISSDQLTPNAKQSATLLPFNHYNSTSEYKKIVSDKFWSNIDKYPWFMKGGELRPHLSLSSLYSILPLFPDEDPSSDRIANQLMYIPANYDKIIATGKSKVIYIHNAMYTWGGNEILNGDKFKSDRCPVHTCSLTIDPAHAENADAVIFKDYFSPLEHPRRYSQIWILYLLESPLHTSQFQSLHSAINWTATYRYDSDIVTPYQKYFHLSTANLPPTQVLPTEQTKKEELLNRFRSKSSKAPVAWFVSNCAPSNNRGDYADELSKYIKVDIYGSCGTKVCPRRRNQQCFNLLSSGYKFYLSFENSNCKDYITEKYYVNGLQNNVIPIVMGANKADYIATSPPNSFIHVDDYASPKELAEYLKVLAQNETMYLSYFKWKLDSNWFNINTYFWCRLCAMLHSPRATSQSHFYPNVGAWWSGRGICQPRA